MKKILFITIAAIAAGGFLWQYLPPALRSKATAFAGAALQGNTSEMKRIASTAVVSEDLSERRKMLLNELEKNLAVIKQGGKCRRACCKIRWIS